MKKLLLLPVLFSILAVIPAYSQQQPENPGFEYWEEIGFGPDTLEPSEWSSLKTSDGGSFINNIIPVVWERSTDSHSGQYSVKLTNLPIAGLIAPGTLTNGRVHATLPPSDAYVYTIDSLPEFNTPFSDMPDSLQVWAKYFPDSTDIAHIIAVLHTDTAKIDDSLHTNWVAVAHINIDTEINQWTKFSAPFEYLNNDTPEYILFAIYAGDAQNAVEGSVLYIDDISMIYYNTGTEEALKPKLKVQAKHSDLIVSFPEDMFNCGTVFLNIYDLTGKAVFSKNFSVQKEVRISTDLDSGIYLCNIHSSTFTLSTKIIIKKH